MQNMANIVEFELDAKERFSNQTSVQRLHCKDVW
jgi:hypothetical protein